MDITISAHARYERTKDFNRSARCVASMFLYHLGKFDAGPFQKIIVEGTPEELDAVEDLVDVVRLRRGFDYAAYWRSPAQKQVLAAFLHHGLLELCNRFGWPSEPMDRALSAMQDRNFDHVVDWRRPISSPSRKLTAQVRYYHTPTEVRLAAVIRSKTGEETCEIELARTEPSEWWFVPLLGRLRWQGDTAIVLEPKRPGGTPIVRSVP